MHEKYIIKDKNKLATIEQAMMDTYFRDYDRAFLNSTQGQVDIDANVFARYNTALKSIIPWVARAGQLAGKSVVEIGCGTGSSTAAFSHYVKKIIGYDIDGKSIDGARARMKIMGLNNVELYLVTPANVIARVLKDHPDGADIILLYAVLEHQTVEERLETIKNCWALLKNEGLLVVTDTPNLLCYHDYHTSLLPFLHMLPTDLYAKYASNSTRKDFKDDFSDYEKIETGEMERKISRWGRGASYHDFELSLGIDYDRCIVCSGFEQEILSHIDVSPEEELLRIYIQRCGLKIPLAFSRVVLNVILQKDPLRMIEIPAVPDNKYFLPIEQYHKLVSKNALLSKTLSEMESSFRWKLGCLLAAPYREFKQLLNRPK